VASCSLCRISVAARVRTRIVVYAARLQAEPRFHRRRALRLSRRIARIRVITRQVIPVAHDVADDGCSCARNTCGRGRERDRHAQLAFQASGPLFPTNTRPTDMIAVIQRSSDSPPRHRQQRGQGRHPIASRRNAPSPARSCAIAYRQLESPGRREPCHYFQPKPSFVRRWRRPTASSRRLLDLELWVPRPSRQIEQTPRSPRGGPATSRLIAPGCRCSSVPASLSRAQGDIHV